MLWNNLHSSTFSLLHLLKILHEFQTTIYDRINLFSPFVMYLPYKLTKMYTNDIFTHIMEQNNLTKVLEYNHWNTIIVSWTSLIQFAQ